MPEIQGKSNDRLLSLDFYRGLTMFLLIAEFSHLFSFLVMPQLEGTFIYAVGTQFHHVRLGRNAFLGFNPTIFYVYCRGGNAIVFFKEDGER